jgi:transposase
MQCIYVGIDWADDHHDVYVTDDTAAKLDGFSIRHSSVGLEELKKRLASFCPDPANVLIAVEWHKGLLIYNLVEAGYQVYPINPKSMDRYRDRYRMSSSKSDPMDAMVLANILRTDLHLYRPLPRQAIADEGLQQLTRAQESLVRYKVKLMNQITAELKNYYPVALKIFSGLDHEITLAFLEHYPTPEKAAQASLKEIKGFFREQHYCCPRRIPAIYQALQEPALKACPELAEVHQAIVLSYIPVLRTVLNQITALDKQISLVFQRSPAHNILTSLPIGQTTAARLNAEIGNNISRFASQKDLQTLAGTAPVTRRSGNTKIVYFRWQCNKHLREAFQSLARESVRRYGWAREYFTNQMRRGHKPSRAYRALANRWVAIVWKMLQQGQPFSQARLEQRLPRILASS